MLLFGHYHRDEETAVKIYHGTGIPRCYNAESSTHKNGETDSMDNRYGMTIPQLISMPIIKNMSQQL
jgi:hypothetical protein